MGEEKEKRVREKKESDGNRESSIVIVTCSVSDKASGLVRGVEGNVMKRKEASA